MLGCQVVKYLIGYYLSSLFNNNVLFFLIDNKCAWVSLL